MSNIFVQYYDRIGGHGGHRVPSTKVAYENIKEILRDNTDDQLLFIEIYNHDNKQGIIYYATQEYLEHIKRLPKSSYSQNFLRSIEQYLLTINKYLGLKCHKGELSINYFDSEQKERKKTTSLLFHSDFHTEEVFEKIKHDLGLPEETMAIEIKVTNCYDLNKNILT